MCTNVRSQQCWHRYTLLRKVATSSRAAQLYSSRRLSEANTWSSATREGASHMVVCHLFAWRCVVWCCACLSSTIKPARCWVFGSILIWGGNCSRASIVDQQCVKRSGTIGDQAVLENRPNARVDQDRSCTNVGLLPRFNCAHVKCTNVVCT